MLGDTPIMRETLARLDDTGRQVLDVELIMLRPDHRPDDVLAVLDAGQRLGARFALVLGYDEDETRLADRFAWVCEHFRLRGSAHARPTERVRLPGIDHREDGARCVQQCQRMLGCQRGSDAVHQ